MAKTKGANPPVNVFSYRDADGTDHFLGEYLRSIFREGSLSRYNPEEDITGLSQRTLRPGQQGPGTPEQQQIRDNFMRCASLWNSLPESTPEEFPDYPITTKESVWDAKIEFGVVCSYYDLFMRCCLNWAQAHNNEMPDGDCFPAVSPCDCEGISISYTTLGMQVDEVQSLTVSGGVEGCQYSWSIDAGGGSLSGESGSSVDFTAPSTNEECDSNATLSLLVGDVICDTIEIAVNDYEGTAVAYEVLGECVSPCKLNDGSLGNCGLINCNWTPTKYCTGCVTNRYRCDGTLHSMSLLKASNNLASAESCAWYVGYYCAVSGEVVDKRTGAMITAGCCPEKLL